MSFDGSLTVHTWEPVSRLGAPVIAILEFSGAAAPDTKRRSILSVTDYERFLRESGYAARFSLAGQCGMEEAMRRVRFSVAMSLDGYIAGPNGESDWIVMDPDIDFAGMMSAFDTIIMGRKTYEVTRQYSGAGMPGTTVYVISRTLRQEDCPGVVVTDNPDETVATLKAATGKDIWLFGGGSLFRSLLELGLVDSVEVAVIPVLLGGGQPLLPPPSGRKKLKLVKHRIYEKTGTISLEYAPAGV